MKLLITIKDSRVQAALSQVVSRLEDPTPLFSSYGEMLVRYLDQGFRDQTDPYRASWAPLAASTLQQKRKRGRIPKALQSTGLLRATLTYQADSRKVVVGYNAKYAVYHQTGTRRTPRRQILPDAKRGLPPLVQDALLDIAKDYFEV